MRASTKLARPLAGPLKAAFDESGLTIAQLIEQAGLDIDVSSMSRKLDGTQSIGIPDEAKAIGKVFKLELDWDGSRFFFAKAGKKSRKVA